ncbi:MAG: SGNH/GDSL hydrolase family protein [Burkholderiaceae bacterium]
MKSFKGLLAVVALGVLGGCGGGGSQIDPFAPNQILVFGDESSAITADGKKYGINGIDPTTSKISCLADPNWVQALALHYGLVLPQCNQDLIAAPQGRMYAVAGAKVADVADQVDKQFASSGFNAKALATVLVGANDILELYAQFPSQSEASLTAEAASRGTALAQQINRIAKADGRVVVSTVPDMGTTPFAYKERDSKFDTNRATLLSNLTSAFNVAMRVALLNDGHYIGLVLMDESTQSIAKFPSAFGYTNVTDAACLSTVAIQNCTSNTLVAGASETTWFWASDTLMGPSGQSRLGSLALTRVQNNPF